MLKNLNISRNFDNLVQIANPSISKTTLFKDSPIISAETYIIGPCYVCKIKPNNDQIFIYVV